MVKIFELGRVVINSKITHYIFSRYFGYFLQFINALLFAKYLGSFFFGVYGFIFILLQYLNYGNLGIQYSMNFFLSTKTSKKIREIIFSLSLGFSLFSSLLILIGFILLKVFDIKIFEKYYLSSYYLLIGIIAFFQIVNQLYINVFRTFGKLIQINFFQIIIPFFQFFGFLFFENEKLLFFILFANVLGNILSFIVFSISNPLKTNFKLNKKIVLSLSIKGVNLLIYNISFYLIMLSGSTMVSIFYSVEELGYYSFGNNLANASMMLMGSISFLFFSKLIFKMEKAEKKDEIIKLVEKSREVYLIFTFLIGLIFFNIIPQLNLFLPEYNQAFKAFQLLLIAQILLSYVFGYSTLLIAKKQEKKLTLNSIYSILINIGLIYFGISFGYGFLFAAWCSIFAVFFYSMKSIYDGNQLTSQYSGLVSFLKANLPLRFFFPVIILMASVYWDKYSLGLLSLIVFLGLNKTQIIEQINFGIEILKNSRKYLELK